jgi:hypothetical protein
MNVNDKSRVNLRCIHNQKILVFVFLLFIMILVSSSFVSVFGGVSPFVSGAPDKVVSTETELRNAINNAAGSTIIALNKDITLTETTLTIPAGKEVTLTSNKASGFYKLTGVTNRHTITVDSGGALTLDGIIVTHKTGELGGGVTTSKDSTLILLNGEITGNTGGYYYNPYDHEYMNEIIADGCGVVNSGTFKMLGGRISNNIRFLHGDGGGVVNLGTFILSGGEITGNTASWGGGVANSWPSVFEMTGGKISNNKATASVASGGGGGVSIGGSYTEKCVFVMSGGEITGNTAPDGKGGGVHNHGGKFTMTGGKISGNTAYTGGGVYGYAHIFEWIGGEISGNTFTGLYGEGDNVYPENSSGPSGGDGGSSNGNNGSSAGNGNSGSNGDGLTGGGASNEDSFSLKEAMIISVGVVVVMVGIIVAIMFFYIQKKMTQIEEKIHSNTETQN